MYRIGNVSEACLRHFLMEKAAIMVNPIMTNRIYILEYRDGRALHVLSLFWKKNELPQKNCIPSHVVGSRKKDIWRMN